MLLPPAACKVARALVVVVVSLTYLAYLFRFSVWLPNGLTGVCELDVHARTMMLRR